MRCKECGAENREDARFCHICGARLTEDPEPDQKEMPQSEPSKSKPAYDSEPAPDSADTKQSSSSPEPDQEPAKTDSRPPFQPESSQASDSASSSTQQKSFSQKKSNKTALFLAGFLVLAAAGGALAFFSSQKPEAEKTVSTVEETDYTTISLPEMEELLENGTPWVRLADSLKDTELSSVSFGEGYYSLELANGKKISAEYAFLPDEETEEEPQACKILFRELTSAGDVSARAEITEEDGEEALIFTFSQDPVSEEAAKKLGLQEEVSFYSKESLERIQSKEKARQQQLERQQQAQKLKEENSLNASSSDSSPQTSESAAAEESQPSQSTLHWDDSTTFVHSPGAGGYFVNLRVAGDGSFTLESEDYDYNQVAYSLARGKFSQPKKIDENSYEVTVESITFYPDELPSDLPDDLDKAYMNFDVTENFPEQFTLYLPQTPLSSLDSFAKSNFHLSDIQQTMDKFGLTDHDMYYFIEMQ